MTFITNLPLRLMLILGLFVCQNLTAQTYCPSKGNLPWTEWIAGVKFGTINNASNKEGYGNFTSQTTNLTQGTSYPLSITQGFSWAPDPANATQQGKVWIDYDKNGTFDATELVASFTRTTTTANVVIPTTALTGATRMRVSFKTIGAPTACEVFDKGEVEDYTVNIQGGTTPPPSCANNALNFDGVNDLLVSSRAAIPANADFTIETSFISTATSTGCSGAFRRLLVFDLSSSLNRFEIGDCAGQLTLYYYFNGLDELVNIPNTSTLRNGNWHHVSVVKQGTNLMIYYDGALVLTRPNMGGVNPVARQLIVGSWVQPIENWQGSIDEVKVWNYAMTATEVQSKRLCQPTDTEANLLLYYSFNQGASSGDNTAITTVLDKSLSANNGIMQNFTLTGATSNFVCSTLPVAPCATTSCANNALNFDGVNDLLISSRAVIPANADFTLEASCISTATSTGCGGAFRRLLVFDLSSSLNRFEIGDCAGQLTVFLSIPGANNNLTNIPNTNLRDGNWHHVSAVKKGTDLLIYYDGSLVFTQANANGINPAARKLIVGSWVQPIENWQGSIDEVKVWNYAMTGAEVQNKRLCQPTGTEANLLLYYPFNQGASSGDNTAITTVLDKSLSANNGLMQNFALTGSTSNFVCSTLPVVPCAVTNLPDLVPDFYTIAGYTVDRTTTFFQAAVSNRGTAASPITGLKVYISRDSVYPSGRLYSDGSVTAINAGSAWQAGGSAGLVDTFQAGVKYYTIAVIDPNNTVMESNESNNIWISKGVIYKNVVVTNSCRYQDSLQLVSLYNATGGANWTTKWNLATPINTWNGVFLDANDCVKNVYLPQNNLVGTLPNLNLSRLEFLTLSRNRLSGALPLFNLATQLKGLFLDENAFSGTIPNWNLFELTNLQLQVNQLTGQIPNFNATKLEFYIAYQNQLSGPLPNFNLYLSLISINLASNLLSGELPSFSSSNLKGVQLSSNRFTGTIPTYNIANLPNIQFLLFNNNQLSGCLPVSLKGFCGKQVEFANNSGLATQDFNAFCTNNAGACTTTNTNDIALSITSTPSVYRIYTSHNFRVKVVNNGTTAFLNVRIKFSRPNLTVNGGGRTASIGTYQDFCPGGIECSEWTIPSLAAGAIATLDAPVFVLAPTGGITASATLLSSAPTDNVVANNTASITVNSANATDGSTSQARALRVPTQLIPVVIQAISPNPTEGDVQIKLDSWTKQTVDFNFSDITGKVIHSEKRDVEKGVNRLDFEVFHLPQGVYFIQTNVGKGKDVPTKFVKM